jgi:TRAP transporter 4TM/12TM fusion protein
MKRSGYSKEQSGAIEAVASTGGQLMPPVMGAGAFLMAEFLRVPYSDIVVAALIPALLYYGALLLVVDLEAAKANIPPVSSEGLPSARRILIDGWSFIATFAIIIFLLFGMHMSPGMAAALGTGFLLVVNLIFGYRGKRINLLQVFDTFAVTGTTVLGIIMIGAVASFVIGVLNVTGLGYALTLLLINLGGNQVGPLLILAALAAIVLGMGMPTVAVYALLGVLIAPSMVHAGIEPIAAHMFVFYFGILSGVTPPVAVAAFAAAHVANGDPFRTCFHAMCFGWSAYIVPFLFVLSPSLLLIGAPGEVTLAVVTAFAGVALATAGMAAYLFAPLGLVQRVLMFIAGIAIMIPANTFPGAIYTDIGGSVLGAILLGFNWHARATSPDKRKPAPVVASVTSGNP